MHQGQTPLSVAAALVAVTGLVVLSGMPVQTLQAPVDSMTAAYAALSSYSDTGTIRVEYQLPGAPRTVDTVTFETAYAKPKRFLLSSTATGPDGERFAVWSAGDYFETWWSASGVHQKFPPGQGVSALVVGSLPTRGASVNIPSLLFSQAEIHSSIMDLAVTKVGRETINGVVTDTVSGVTQGHFGLGRPMTIWIDASTHLIVRMVEDTPTDAPAGSVDRIVTEIRPRANPVVPATRFAFPVPPPP